MIKDIIWIRKYIDKICPLLRKSILTNYRYPKLVPRFLHKPWQFIKDLLFKHRVIVELDEDHYAYVLEAGSPQKILGCKVTNLLNSINGFATAVNIKTLQKLVVQDEVLRVSKDRKIQALLDIATPTVNAPPVWNSNLDGQGVGIAIIDTGIDPHPDLIKPVNRIIAFKDYIKKRSKPYDDNGHGTHCAGDAAGNGYKSNGLYKGPAPRANLIGIKVLNKYGWGYESTVISGIQWCVQNKNKYGIKIISMSLGATADVPASQDPLCKAVKAAWESGLVVCVAAGNNGPASGTINTPGIEPAIITVGALNDSNTSTITDDSIASFSSRGPTIDGLSKPDLVSPGVKITSLRVSGSYLDKAYPYSRTGKYYATFSGTSMATPVCAGAAALILQNSPSLTPAQVKNNLTATCRTIYPDPYAQGSGLIDAKAAINS